MGCRDCWKKVKVEGDTYKCPRCPISARLLRFRILLNAVDADVDTATTPMAEFTFFGKEAVMVDYNYSALRTAIASALSVQQWANTRDRQLSRVLTPKRATRTRPRVPAVPREMLRNSHHGRPVRSVVRKTARQALLGTRRLPQTPRFLGRDPVGGPGDDWLLQVVLNVPEASWIVASKPEEQRRTRSNIYKGEG